MAQVGATALFKPHFLFISGTVNKNDNIYAKFKISYQESEVSINWTDVQPGGVVSRR